MATNFWGFDGSDSLNNGGVSNLIEPLQLPDLVVDDLMLMWISISPPTDGGVVPTITSTPSGWPEYNTHLQGELRTYIYYRRALTVDDVWPNLALSATVNWCVCQARVRDVDWTSGPFGNVQAAVATNSGSVAAPALTTAANNSAILLLAASEFRTITSLGAVSPLHNRRIRVNKSNGITEGICNSAAMCSDYSFLSGTSVGGQNWAFSGSSNDVRLWSIEVRTNGNVVPPWLTEPPTTVMPTGDYGQSTNDSWRDAFMASGKLLDADTIATYSFDASTVTTGTSHSITITGHGITSSRVVQAAANGNTLPTGLTDGAYYWCRVIDADTVRLLPCEAVMSAATTYFKTSATAGAFLTAVNITAAGTGTCRLKDAGMVWSANGDFLRAPLAGNVADALGSYKGDAGYNQNWVGYARTWTSVLNLSGYKQFFTTNIVNNAGGINVIRYGVIVFIDTSNNWAAYKVYDQKYSTALTYTTNVFDLDDPDVTAVAWRSSGTLDLANIKHMVWACKGSNTSVVQFGTAVGMTDPIFINTIGVLGGTATYPLTYAEVAEHVRAFSPDTITISSDDQYVSRQPMTFGNGTSKVYWRDNIKSLGHFAPANGVSSYSQYIDKTKYAYNLSSDSSVSFLTSQVVGAKTEWDMTSISVGTAAFDNTTFSLATILCDSNVPMNGCIFDSSTLTQNGTVISNCVFQGSAVSSDDPGDISGSSFTSGGTGHAITITAPGTYTFAGNSFTGYGADGTTDAAIYNNSGGLVTLNLGQGDVAPTVRNGAGASTIVNAIQNGLNLSGLVSGSQVYVFTTTTQSVLDSTESSGATFTYVSSATIDLTIYKAGYLPIRVTGINLGSGSYISAVDQIADPNYVAGHGLTYTTDASYNPATSRLTVPSWSATRTVRNVYSLLIDSYISEATLKNKAFPFQMNGGTSLFLLDDAECTSDVQAANMVGGGIRYVSAAGVTTAEFLGVVSQGVTAGLQPRYELSDNLSIIAARTTGNVNEIIKVYGDASHGNFDYRDGLDFKVQANGYRQAAADVLALAGTATLEPVLYSIPLTTVAIPDFVTGDPGATGLSITDDSASPVSWDAGNGAKDYSLTITDAGTNSGETILRWLNYNLAQTATFQGKAPFAWPEMVTQIGSAFETVRGTLHNGGDILVGVRVIRTGGTPHPDFSRFQADDGTYGTPPVVASLSVGNIQSGSRLQVYNVTTDTETVNEVVAGTSYTDTYTDGTGYTAGDEVRIRLTYQSGTSAKCGWTTTVVASSNGWAVSADQQDCPVYNTLAVDGSTITYFEADYVDDEVDIIVASNFYISDWYAWWMFNLTTEDGIRYFFGGVTGEDIGNFLINNDTVDIFWDNTTTTEVWALDNRRVRRSDGARPIKSPTTGGGGIDLEWREKVLLAETGVSGLTTEEATTLAKLDAVAVKADEIHRIHGLKSGEPMTVTPTSRTAGSISQTISGDGTASTTVTRS